MLKIMRELGVISVVGSKQKMEFIRLIKLIEDSRDPVQLVWPDVRPKDHLCQHIHSHKHLKKIFKILWSPHSVLHKMAPRGSFTDLLFRLVFFHQSLPGVEEYPPMVQLSEREILLYCDPLMLKLMCVIQTADSSSYTYITMGDVDRSNYFEFLASNQQTISKWKK